MVSYFPSAKQPNQATDTDLVALLEDIRTGRWRKEVGLVRSHPIESERKRLKLELPGFTPSGTFSHRRKDGLREHSGFMVLDIDAQDNPGFKPAQDRRPIEADPYTFASFISCGGKGLAVLVRVPGADYHEASFRALVKYYADTFGLVLDGSGKDVCRYRYVSHDPDLYHNPVAEVFDAVADADHVKPSPPAPAPVSRATFNASRNGQGHGQTALDMAVGRFLAAPNGQKRTLLNKYAYLLGGYVGAGLLGEAEAATALRRAVDVRGAEIEDLRHAYRTIDEGLRDGQQKPVLPEQLKHWARQQLGGNFSAASVANAAAILSAQEGVQVDLLRPAIADLVTELSNEPQLLTFWFVPEPLRDKPRPPQLSLDKYLGFLSAQGFRKHRAGGNYATVRVQAQVVEEVDRGQLIDFVRGYVAELPFAFDGITRLEVLNMVAVAERKLFDPLFLQQLPTLSAELFLRDTATTGRLYFRNVWAEVTADGVALREYSDLPGLIWASQVVPRDFVALDPAAAEQADFHRFLRNITAQDSTRLHQLQVALGYLLHAHKSEMETRAVILVDEVSTDGRAEGRTGKSLLMKAVGQVVKTTQLKGATFKPEDPFCWAPVTEDTRVTYFDEWDGRRLKFEDIFSELTDGLTINRKYQQPQHLPYALAPKFAVTTNDMVTGKAGGSGNARKLEIPLAPHYSAAFTPRDDFGGGFFGEHWDADEYNRFYNLVVGWLQAYLRQGGLVLLESAAVKGRMVEAQTSAEFVAWLDAVATQKPDPNTSGKLWASELWAEYCRVSGENPNRFTLRVFMKWMGHTSFTKHRHTSREIIDGAVRRFEWYYLPPTTTQAEGQ